MWGAAGNYRSDFDLITVVEHLVFGDQIIAFDHQVRFDDKIQLAQEVLGLFGPFDLDRSGRVTQLDLHEGMIRLELAGLQESNEPSAISTDPESFRSCKLMADR